MALLTALGMAAGGYAQGRQQRLANQAEQQRLQEQASEFEEQKKLDAANLQQIQQQNQATQRDILFRQGLRYPAHWGNMTPQQQYNYLQVRLNAAMAAGASQDTISNIQAQMNALPLGTERFAAGAEHLTRAQLDQAQAAYWRDRPAFLRQELQAKMQMAGAAQAAAMQRAYLYAKTRLATAAMGADEREAIALQTALQLAQYHNQDEAFRASEAQANAANQTVRQTYEEQLRAYYAGDTNAPTTMPQPPQYVAPPSPPVTTNIYMVQPNGQVKQMKVPALPNYTTPRPPRPTPAQYTLQDIEQAERGQPQAKVKADIDAGVKAGYISAQTRNQAYAHFGIPLPIGHGASGSF
jgi:hypothetical protein